MKFTSSFSIQ